MRRLSRLGGPRRFQFPNGPKAALAQCRDRQNAIARPRRLLASRRATSCVADSLGQPRANASQMPSWRSLPASRERYRLADAADPVTALADRPWGGSRISPPAPARGEDHAVAACQNRYQPVLPTVNRATGTRPDSAGFAPAGHAPSDELGKKTDQMCLPGREKVHQDLKQHEAEIERCTADLQKSLPTPVPGRGP
jgi:hypothetical protein